MKAPRQEGKRIQSGIIPKQRKEAARADAVGAEAVERRISSVIGSTQD